MAKEMSKDTSNVKAFIANAYDLKWAEKCRKVMEAAEERQRQIEEEEEEEERLKESYDTMNREINKYTDSNCEQVVAMNTLKGAYIRQLDNVNFHIKKCAELELKLETQRIETERVNKIYPIVEELKTFEEVKTSEEKKSVTEDEDEVKISAQQDPSSMGTIQLCTHLRYMDGDATNMPGDDNTVITSPSATLVSKIDASDPLFLHPSDSANLSIVSVKLKGSENYRIWSNAMYLALQLKNKIGFVDGSCLRSKTDEVLGRQWDRCNSIVLTWILNSVSEELYLGLVYSKIASDVWKDLKDTYDKIDGSVVFNMYQKINSFSQNGMPVSEYYHKLNCMWKQLDQLLTLPACSCDASKQFNDFNHLIKLMQFLMGLDSSYQSVRINLLTRETLPSVKDDFSVISREESHLHSKNIFDKTPNNPVGCSVKTGQVIDSRKRNNRTPNPNLKCSHCNKTGHTIEKCFELVGYPSWIKSKPGGNKGNKVSNNVTTDTTDTTPSMSSLSNDQIAQLLSLLNDKPKGDTQNSGFAGMCANPVCLNSFVNLSSKPICDFKPAFCFSNFINNGKKIGWIVDSGANQHMVMTDEYLINQKDVTEFNIKVKHPNGTSALVTKIGDIKLSDKVILYDVFVVPDYCVNLISVHKLARDCKLIVSFDEQTCYIQDSQTKKVQVTSSQFDGLYFCGSSSVSNKVGNSSCDINLWHARLGHPAEPVLHVLKNNLNIKTGAKLNPCETCHRAKQHREPFPLSDHKSEALGNLIHLDVWGPYRVQSMNGFRYFLTVVDDYSRVVTPSSVLSGKSPYELVFGFTPVLGQLRVIGCLCFSTVLNNSDKFTTHAEKCVLVGYSNEKKGYKLWSLDQKMMFFPRDVRFYETVFSFKEKKTFSDPDTPTEVNTLNFFDLSDLNFTQKPQVDPTTDDETSHTNTSTGHGFEQSENDSEIALGMAENQQPSNTESNSDRAEHDTEQEDNNNSEGDIGEQNNTVLRRSSRNSNFPSKFDDFIVDGKVKYGLEKVLNYANLSPESFCFASVLNKSCEPKNYFEAKNDANWVDAMNSELEALLRNKTWEIVDLPPNRKAIGCKWVYKIKYKSNCEIERYKARLVAKGFSQKEGIDFFDTFSPVVKMVAIRCVLSMVVHFNWEIYQLDINNAFLYGDLNEEIYMFLPDGYNPSSESKVCKLKKSLYGLKQAPRMWNEKLVSVLVDLGFKQSKCDHSMFVMTKDTVFIVLLVYVDDIIVSGDNLVSWKSKKQSTVSRSSAEAEYRSMCAATCEIIWISNLLRELQIDSKLPVQLYCDNTTAISIAANPVFHERTKHFEIDLFFL
ncbi:uncharacterized protein LOC118479628 [Helianthus annuus]|uniref:uncharacterized protein LOC118479628 n=1 Tax=Helianthus annuus TaxID=4232 RepID=UPI0016531EF6|nr:uncharacterized protein LOC118479628 [Helianthus annuus]